MIVTESNIEKINNTFTQVKDISFYEKKNSLHSEEIVNTFLDKILELKRILDKKTQSITKLNIQLEELTKKGIVKTEIKALKESISDLKEMTQDVESRFFFLPQMLVFTEATKELTLI